MRDYVPFRDFMPITTTFPGDNRLKQCRRCISHPVRYPVLDIGAKNFVGEYLRDYYHIPTSVFHNTEECDFNEELLTPLSTYGTIFCFEVLEHVMNPLLFVQNIRKLMDANSVLYLSTPLGGSFNWFFCKAHLSEYRREPLKLLFNYAGLEIASLDVSSIIPPSSLLTGIRPWLRVFLQRSQFYTLKTCDPYFVPPVELLDFHKRMKEREIE